SFWPHPCHDGNDTDCLPGAYLHRGRGGLPAHDPCSRTERRGGHEQPAPARRRVEVQEGGGCSGQGPPRGGVGRRDLRPLLHLRRCLLARGPARGDGVRRLPGGHQGQRRRVQGGHHGPAGVEGRGGRHGGRAGLHRLPWPRVLRPLRGGQSIRVLPVDRKILHCSRSYDQGLSSGGRDGPASGQEREHCAV
ncbi:hypothetical protein T484DRAFT_1913009, partial [Baffinella frigidus]